MASSPLHTETRGSRVCLGSVCYVRITLRSFLQCQASSTNSRHEPLEVVLLPPCLVFCFVLSFDSYLIPAELTALSQ